MTDIQLTEFQQRACAIGIVKMLNRKHFSICDLDALAKTMGRETRIGGKDYGALRALHCMDWADMGPELAAMVREKCLEILGIPKDFIDGISQRETSNEAAHGPAGCFHLAFWRK